MGKAAVWYCEHNFAIIPLKPKQKEPASKNGLNDWTDNPESARQLWTMNPDFNIGIVCGVPSKGLLVLDFDQDEDKDKDGYRTLNEWSKVHGELPETVSQITGSGGMHLFYRTGRTNIKNSVNHNLGVDIRTDGGYIVAPPSIHPNGRKYAWQDYPEEVEVATANDAVYDFLDHIQRNGGQSEDEPERQKFELPDVIDKGGRDDTLARYGFSLRGQGYSDEIIQAMVEKANNDRCKPPLPKRDIDRIVRSVCSKGPGHDGLGYFIDEDAPEVHRPGGSGGAIPNFKTKRGALDHAAVGQYIIDHDHARYIDGAPAVWTGKRWNFDTNAIDSMVRDYVPSAKKAEVAEVVAYVAVKAPHVESTNFDGNRYVQFRNATVNVNTFETVEPDPSMLVTNTLKFDFDPDVGPNAADDFLDAISANDRAVRAVLEEIIGATITCGHTVSQSPMLIGRSDAGTASNGKSTFIKVLQKVAGSHNVSALDIATLGQRFQSAGILGKLANLGDDIPDGFLKSDELATFKKVVSGDTIYTDVKGGKGFMFTPMALCVFSMNTIPRLDDSSDGIFRRLAFVPFRRHFDPMDDDYDPNIIDKLAKPETLQRFAALGMMRMPSLIERSVFAPIPEMEQELDEVKQNNDVVLRWVYEESIDVKNLDEKFVSDIYEDFREWCHKAGERFPVTQTAFSRRLCVSRFLTSSVLKTYPKYDARAHKNRRAFKLEV